MGCYGAPWPNQGQRQGRQHGGGVKQEAGEMTSKSLEGGALSSVLLPQGFGLLTAEMFAATTAATAATAATTTGTLKK